MDWIRKYQLFLFDFDGLLVNTEALHLAAYRQMCAERGFDFDLDLATYNRVAQFDSSGPKNAIYERFPALAAIEWEILRARKVEIYIERLSKGDVELMPGAFELLSEVKNAGIAHCVVTHSKREQIDPIVERHPVLRAIPHWITREDYTQPKPHPEGYSKAISKFGRPGGRVIGFEDSPKGLQALLGAGASAVLVSPYFEKKEMEAMVKGDFLHFESLEEISL
jgi:beta-phosphoglucomutase